MKSSLLKSQLREIKKLEARINPDSGWVRSNREKMLSQIGHATRDVETKSTVSRERVWQVWSYTFVPRGFVRSFKPVMALIVALVLTTSGWMASAYAEPGDVLWNAKNAINSVVETGRLAIAREDEQVSLRLSYATKQAEVVRQVVESDAVSPEKKARMIERNVENLQKKLNSAEESIKAVSPDRAVELVREVSVSTMQISQTLRESAERAGITDDVLIQKLEKKASETTKQSLEMMGVVVQRRSDANIKISDEEEKIVRAHIERVVESIVTEIRRMEASLVAEQSRAVATADTSGSISAVAIGEEEVETMDISTTSTTGTAVTTTVTTSSTTSTTEKVGTATNTLTLTLEQALSAVQTLDEQKSIVDLLKQSDILEALQGTKNLAEQVSLIIERMRARDVENTVPTTNTDTTTTIRTQSTSTLSDTPSSSPDTTTTPAG